MATLFRLFSLKVEITYSLTSVCLNRQNMDNESSLIFLLILGKFEINQSA